MWHQMDISRSTRYHNIQLTVTISISGMFVLFVCGVSDQEMISNNPCPGCYICSTKYFMVAD